LQDISFTSGLPEFQLPGYPEQISTSAANGWLIHREIHSLSNHPNLDHFRMT
jgi:hypothetical protein